MVHAQGFWGHRYETGECLALEGPMYSLSAWQRVGRAMSPQLCVNSPGVRAIGWDKEVSEGRSCLLFTELSSCSSTYSLIHSLPQSFFPSLRFHSSTHPHTHPFTCSFAHSLRYLLHSSMPSLTHLSPVHPRAAARSLAILTSGSHCHQILGEWHCDTQHMVGTQQRPP